MLGCALVAGVVAIALLLLLVFAWNSSGSHGHAAASLTPRAGPAVVITPAKVSAPARGMSAGAAGG